MSTAANLRGVLLSVHLKENHTKVRLRALEDGGPCTETRELLEGARENNILPNFLIILYLEKGTRIKLQ